MDLVLGLGMTSRAVRWVLVEGTTGEGHPVDRGAIAMDDVATYDPDGLLRGLVDDTEATGMNRIHAIGVTWTCDAAPLASNVLQSLEMRGYANVVSVSEVEAAAVLATGIAEMSDYDDVAVCIVEPDAAVVATVTPDAINTDRIDRSPDDTTAGELVGNIASILKTTGRRARAIFVLGSDGQGPIVSALADVAMAPVISAAQSDLAYPRGAALAAALAVNTHDGQLRPARALHLTKVGALTSVLVAAVVTLVVAASAAVGIQLHPGAVSPEMANVSEPAPAASPPSVGNAVPKPRPAAPPPAPAAPAPTREAVPAPAAEVDSAPAHEPPAYVPPAPAPEPEPAYVPPPPPAFVPPPAPPPVTYPQPRLRDRLIERIPIIGRFHEPKPWG